MRLLFLCSSLEPGRDGVGDYVRTLGASCAERGVAVQAVALNEPGVVCPGDERHLRLSSARPWAERRAAVQEAIDRFAPDWISLQFVPYGFDPRGLTFELNRLLGALKSRASRHVMFHETWITAGPGASWKRRLTGLLQRQAIRMMLVRFRASVAHTSTAEYRDLLTRVGVEAELLPIFGNIPLAVRSDAEWLWAALGKIGVELTPRPLLAVLFGSLYPEWDPLPLMKTLRAAGRRACFLSIGHLREGAARWARMARDFAGEHQFVRLGPLPGEQISAALAAADVGVTPMPLGIIEKSGTTAAMLEHGLSVLVTRFDAPPAPEELARLHGQGIFPVTDELARELRSGLPKRAPKSLLPEVTDRFLARLGFSSVKGQELLHA